MKNEKPKIDDKRVVKIHDVTIDSNYAQWLNEIKSRYRSAQIKAAVKVNTEQLQYHESLVYEAMVRVLLDTRYFENTPPAWWRIAII